MTAGSFRGTGTRRRWPECDNRIAIKQAVSAAWRLRTRKRVQRDARWVLCARAGSRGAAVSRKPPGGGGKGHAHKHAGGKKHHHRTVKHHPGHHKQHSHHGGGPAPPVVVKGHHHHPARGWAPGTDVACCAAEALGTLLGRAPPRVLEGYLLTARGPASGAFLLSAPWG